MLALVRQVTLHGRVGPDLGLGLERTWLGQDAAGLRPEPGSQVALTHPGGRPSSEDIGGTGGLGGTGFECGKTSRFRVGTSQYPFFSQPHKAFL